MLFSATTSQSRTPAGTSTAERFPLHPTVSQVRCLPGKSVQHVRKRKTKRFTREPSGAVECSRWAAVTSHPRCRLGWCICGCVLKLPGVSILYQTNTRGSALGFHQACCLVSIQSRFPGSALTAKSARASGPPLCISPLSGMLPAPRLWSSTSSYSYLKT